ncbi:HAD-IIB family hydrolase [Leptolyngbya sp. CCNP1308]|uniref:HAD-IIB family hydrolase n=1 Tax=Leptolyngbya sp. CCNP1308 TaxID=3110255 RepID=UPI002B212BC3|nr:HAD-IIB family hydrolase [Leptolyngbya sp. CCNP1308]MEA5452339.1 HAD-IIB family hydrolase [Leptolyngbya sp. CCNP1308]
MACIIFTDLDGTLLNGETYAYHAALPTLAKLTEQGIPVVPVTSKTRQEVAQLRQDIGLRDPFVVENGSAIYIPTDQTRFALPPGDDVDGYRILPLGCNYVTARAGLKAIAQDLGRPLKGFGDWSVDQVMQLTGLSPEEAKQAKTREFTEPFMTPKNVPADQLREAVEAMGFRVVIGDRFSHLIGAGAGKGRAVHQLVQLYQVGNPEAPTITTIGLGNSPNDLDMLENVDYPIVLPGAHGPHPQLADRSWPVAPAAAPEGWAQAVEAALAKVIPQR